MSATNPDSSDIVPRLPQQGYAPEHVAQRRTWAEQRTDTALPHAADCTIDSEQMRGNIESPIGSVQMPLGVAGPLRVLGKHAEGVFYVPMATTEGALVRSYERGMTAITRSGGAAARLFRDENKATPIFTCQDVAAAYDFVEFVTENLTAIQAAADATTQHGKLLRMTPRPLGRDVAVDFSYHTGDAHGMNMIAKSTDAACRWIVERFPVESWLVMSGGSSEKRPSGSLLAGGKGKYVTAGVRLSPRLTKMYLHAPPSRLVDLWKRTAIGQMASGVLGYNGHYANGLTALFIATGQDVANIANSAVGVTNLEVIGDGDLYASVTLPSLVLATVGGGTALGTNPECLEMLGCRGSGKAAKFAEIAAAVALAGELSFAAALATGEFVHAHESYGRNRPEEGNR